MSAPDGDDQRHEIVITADDNHDGDPNDFGMLLVQNLVTDLGLQQLLGNRFFDEAGLIEFLIRGNGDGNEKGIIVFEDERTTRCPSSSISR